MFELRRSFAKAARPGARRKSRVSFLSVPLRQPRRFLFPSHISCRAPSGILWLLVASNFCLAVLTPSPVIPVNTQDFSISLVDLGLDIVLVVRLPSWILNVFRSVGVFSVWISSPCTILLSFFVSSFIIRLA